MASQRSKKGIFIVFEGGEGSGKTTQVGHLTSWLQRKNVIFRETREPGGTPVGKQIREILLNPYTKEMGLRTELLLYAADRAQHVEEVIKPALKNREVVVSDRYTDSTLVYQGMCRGFGVKITNQLNDFATDRLRPDLVFILDIPLTVSKDRIKYRRLDRLELEKNSFHERVRKGFRSLAKNNKSRYKLIDGTRKEEEIAEEIQKYTLQLLRRRGLGK